MVQIFLGGWDGHQGIYNSMPQLCRHMDRPCATFGLTPMVQDIFPEGMTNAGCRGHHKDALRV